MTDTMNVKYHSPCKYFWLLIVAVIVYVNFSPRQDPQQLRIQIPRLEHHEKPLTQWGSQGYVNQNYTSHEGLEWSFDTLEKKYRMQLTEAVYTRLNASTASKDVLFVDGREHCENARGFLTAVRQGGFIGKIVFFVYYANDEFDCQPLANDFQPMLIFYRDTSLSEPTMLQYHGIVSYAKAFHEEVTQIEKAVIVKPEAVYWCNRTNPFDDIPSPVATLDSIYAVVGKQTDIHSFEHRTRNSSHSCYNSQGLYNHTDDDRARKENTIIDSFVAASNFGALLKLATIVLEEYNQRDLDYPLAAHDLLKHFQTWSYRLSLYLKGVFVEMLPKNRYLVADCSVYLPEDSSCQTCEQATVMVGTSACVRRVTYDEPNYTPFCHQPYREAIMEVPRKTSMAGYAYPHVLEAAHRIRDNNNKIFTEGSNNSRSVSSVCSQGTMAVVSMMAGYPIAMVDRFIGSFLSHADPHCSKLVMIISPNMGLESVARQFPGRVEFVLLDEKSEYYPVKLRGCTPADSRFEVAQRWLEKNFHRFRYVIAPDARDYLWQSDPLAQLIKILNRQGYQDDEFVGSVAEPYVFGGQTHPSWVVARLNRRWITSCGPLCVRKISKIRYTNGEPLAILNCGHIIGTSLGLLHYLRFHIRMMNESGHICDGTDQGLFTYYMYGMLQEAQYPHKVLTFSSSRSGFANMPTPSRMSKRMRVDDPNPEEELQLQKYSSANVDRDENNTVKYNILEKEYVITDCDNNIISGLHQFDRHRDSNFLLEKNPNVWKPWVPWRNNKTFAKVFGKPKYYL